MKNDSKASKEERERNQKRRERPRKNHLYAKQHKYSERPPNGKRRHIYTMPKKRLQTRKHETFLSLDFILFGYRGASMSYIICTCHMLFVFSYQLLFHSLFSIRSMEKVFALLILCAYFPIFFFYFIFQIVRESTNAHIVR